MIISISALPGDDEDFYDYDDDNEQDDYDKDYDDDYDRWWRSKINSLKMVVTMVMMKIAISLPTSVLEWTMKKHLV